MCVDGGSGILWDMNLSKARVEDKTMGEMIGWGGDVRDKSMVEMLGKVSFKR